MLLAAVFMAGIAGAQTPAPDIDSAAEALPAPPKPNADQHILGVIPNYATVNEPSQTFHPIPAREKFVLAAHDSFDPFNCVVAGVYAAVYQWQGDYPQWGQGASGYAKRYGATFSDGAINTYFSEAILPTLLHQDPRYFRLGEGAKWRRVRYALTRVIITRADSGAKRFNSSEIAGNLMSASLETLYYPPLNRTAGDAFEKFGIAVVSDAGFNVLREFWPDIRHKFLHR